MVADQNSLAAPANHADAPVGARMLGPVFLRPTKAPRAFLGTRAGGCLNFDFHAVLYHVGGLPQLPLGGQ